MKITLYEFLDCSELVVFFFSPSKPITLFGLNIPLFISSHSESTINTDPQPKNISAEELPVLTSCLTRWKEEVQTTIAQYESDISNLKHDISQAYEQDHLKKVATWYI